MSQHDEDYQELSYPGRAPHIDVTPISLAESHELADILHTLTNSGTALITSARELVAVYEKTRNALAALAQERDEARKEAAGYMEQADRFRSQTCATHDLNHYEHAELTCLICQRDEAEAALAAEREQVRFWQTEAVNACVEGAVLIAEAGIMPRCGTCADWGVDQRVPTIRRGCGSDTSACGVVATLWPANHGCPQWKAKEGK